MHIHTFLNSNLTAAAKSLQSCPTLCDPVDGSPPGSPIPGILQARTLEWVAISFSNVWEWKVKVKSLSDVRLFETPWTATYQAPPSMGFSRQEYWSGVPLPFPGLVRSLQPPDILWIHWKVYNSIANTSKGVLFLPPSDVYVRSFLYLLYTWIKLYYTKALKK